MVFLKNSKQTFEQHTFIESFQNKEPDCTLYSKEGFKFRIHKEILFQAEKMRNILISELNGCCHNIEMLCPCDGNELESILKLIYNGKISYRTPLFFY